MSDVAALGLAVDSSQLTGATKGLKDFAAAAGPAEQGANAVVAATAKGKAAAQGMADGVKQADAAQKQLASSSAKTNDALKTQFKHLNDNVTASGLARHELINLSRQAQDVAVSLAGGQSPLTVLFQQGSQIGDVFASSKATLGDFFRQASSWAGGFLTVGRVAFGGVAAGILAATVATNSFLDAQQRVAVALTGAGRASGATASSINGIAQSGASFGGLSVSEARDFAAALASTGKVANDNILPIVKMGKDIAIAFGVDAKDAAALLANAFADPVKGADDLNQRLGFLDAGLKRNITNLVAQNNAFGAQQALMAGVKSGLDGINETVSGSTKLWTILGNAVSNAWDATGSFLARGLGLFETMDEKLLRAKASLQALQAQADGGASAIFGSGGDLGYVPQSGDIASIEKAQAEVDRLTAAISKQATASLTAAAAQRSFAQETAVRSLVPEIAQREALNNQLRVMADLMKDLAMDEAAGARLKALGLTFEAIAEALRKANSEVKNFKTDFEQATQAQVVQLKSITAFSPSAKGDIAYQQRYNAELARGVEESKAGALADGDRAIALKSVQVALSEAGRARVLAANQSVQSTQLEIDMVGKSLGQQTEMRANLQARQALEQQASQNRTAFNDAEYAQIQKINEELGKRAQLAAIKGAQSNADFATNTLFMSPNDLAAAQVMKNLYGDEWQSHMDDALAKQLKMNAQLSDAKDTAQQFASSFVQGLSQGKSGMDALIGAADALASKMADKALTDLFSGNFIQAGVEGVIAIGAHMFSAGQKAQKELKEAQAEWAKAGPAFETFLRQMTGGVQGDLARQFDAALQTTTDLSQKAYKARDWTALARIQDAYNEDRLRESKKFVTTFNATLEGLADGLGPDSPFLKAVETVKSQLASVQSFVDDARTAFNVLNGDIDGNKTPGFTPSVDQLAAVQAEVTKATDSATSFLLSLLQATPALSAVQTGLLNIRGTATALQGALEQLGLSSEDAAQKINAGVTAAIQALAATFTDGLQREINSALNQGYLNSTADLIAKRATALADAASLGTGSGLVDRWFSVQAQKVVDDAQLTGDAFNQLVAAFPPLQGVVHAFVAQATSDTAAFQSAQQTLQRRTQDLTSAYNAQASVLKSTISTMQQSIDQLKKYQQSLLLNTAYTTLNPLQQYQAAKAQFESVSGLAQSGDATALGQLQDVSQAYLDASKAYYASSEQYFDDFNEVQAVLIASGAAAQTQVDVAQLQLNVLNEQVGRLIDINDSVMSVADAIAAFMAAQGAAKSASGFNGSVTLPSDSSQGLNISGDFSGNNWSNYLSTLAQSQQDALGQYVHQGYASGTDFARGGLSWVGERGPELMNVPRGAQIIPNSILSRSANDNGDWDRLARAFKQVSNSDADRIISKLDELLDELGRSPAKTSDAMRRVGHATKPRAA